MSNPVSRRTAIAAGAWSVPVVVLASAIPAHATSTGGRSTVVLDRAWLYPDETTTIRVTRVDAAGKPLIGEPVWLAVADSGVARIDQPTGVTDSAGTYVTSLRIITGAAPVNTTVSVASSGSTASTPLEIRQTAVIMHDATGASTTVLALPHGSQDAVRDIENRGFSHSDLQPTGRWVLANDVLDVNVTDGPASALSLSFGARGPWQPFNGGQNVDVASTALTAGRQQVTAPRDGIVFVTNSSVDRVATLTITGGRPQPVWVKDRTTAGDFAAQLTDFSAAPVVSIVGERAFADVQRRLVDDLRTRGVSWDPADVAFRLDRVLADTCDVYGLTYSAVGIARKHPGRAYFSGADSGAGWAFATNQWLSFQIDTGASETLLTTPDSWGIWHEVGHTFQTPSYTWGGLGEVTVNISSLALQQRLTGQHRLDDWPEAKDRIRRYFDQPIGDRHFSDLVNENPFWPLFFFDQLRQAFGEGFYPAVDQRYRVRRGQGAWMPSTDQEKIDTFALVASDATDRDLSPFFADWGLALSASTVSSTSSHPALTHRISAAIDSRDAVVERAVGYNVPVADFSIPGVTLDLGDSHATQGAVTGLTSLAGTPSRVVSRGSTAINVGPGEGRMFAVLEADDRTPELLSRTVGVTVTSALEFVGIYDIRAGWLGISRDGSHLVATSTGFAPHDYYFRGKLYYRLTLLDPRGTTLVDVTVNGDETHDKVVNALNGVACGEGYRVRVQAAEPWRVHEWTDSQRVGQLPSSPRTLTIRGGRFQF